jgi:hypothetical protein
MAARRLNVSFIRYSFRRNGSAAVHRLPSATKPEMCERVVIMSQCKREGVLRYGGRWDTPSELRKTSPNGPFLQSFYKSAITLLTLVRRITLGDKEASWDQFPPAIIIYHLTETNI